MSSKRYPEEFKIEAVKRVIGRGHSIASAAIRLDITIKSSCMGKKSTALIHQPLKYSLTPSLRSSDFRRTEAG